ncbi:mitochondrial tetratricopeptide repeat (TPR) domain-containing protein [Andalucia godoyi]|uniref:Mitochondrial tetratricopeptide repeat (TPR) domain-containing protein n=1 Tax=Andalucia godoyi TaxID=505711 RepID=A0A8K0AHU2_ANDGO|nr:mitochondrial tetratricopeptide repeat (TPR) domain-containing protein [Andalucia godoyi]|eukprot:ANDGO_02233.mRNA.1 mitochondrial tetratricopeptide repeat (TPR) domain-containing protein
MTSSTGFLSTTTTKKNASFRPLTNSTSRELLASYTQSVQGKYNTGIATRSFVTASTAAQISQAHSFLLSGDGDAAIAIVQGILRSFHDPSLDAELLMLLGDAQLQVGEVERCVESFTAALQSEPMLPHAYRGRAKAYEKLGKFENAVSEWRKVGQVDDYSVDDCVAYANSLLACSSFRASGRSIEHGAVEEEDVTQRNDALAQMGKQAVGLYSKAIGMEPSIPGLYFYRAHALHQIGLDSEAEKDLVYIRSSFPNFVDQYVREGTVDSLRAALMLLEERDPRTIITKYKLADMLMQDLLASSDAQEANGAEGGGALGLVHEVLSLFSTVLDRMPGGFVVRPSTLYANRGAIYSRFLGDNDRARTEFQSALEMAEQEGEAAAETRESAVLALISLAVKYTDVVSIANSRGIPGKDASMAFVRAVMEKSVAALLKFRSELDFRIQDAKTQIEETEAASAADESMKPRVSELQEAAAALLAECADLEANIAQITGRGISVSMPVNAFGEAAAQLLLRSVVSRHHVAVSSEQENHGAVLRMVEFAIRAYLEHPEGPSVLGPVADDFKSSIAAVQEKRDAAIQALRDAKDPKKKKKK